MKKTHHGSCHCGKVKFEADFDLDGGTFRCNCSMCFKSRAWLAPVTADAFRVLSGGKDLREYQFGKKRIHHYFCGECGVRPYSRGTDPRGNVSYAVRVNCLDGVGPEEYARAPVRYFDMLHDDPKTPPSETRHL
jgi:hypothetical protein